MVSIATDHYHRMFITHVLSSIKRKWPGNLSAAAIKIEHDNARTHNELTEPEFLSATFEIKLII